MKILFSRHALAQRSERNLSRFGIIQTVRHPDRSIRQSTKRYRAVRRFEKHGKTYLLVVIYDAHRSTREIVTAFLTSKIKKYL